MALAELDLTSATLVVIVGSAITSVVGGIVAIATLYQGVVLAKIKAAVVAGDKNAVAAAADAKDTLVKTGGNTKQAVDEVKSTLEKTSNIQNKKQDESLAIIRATHTLVNKETFDKLRTIRDDKKELYELKKDTPEAPKALADLHDAEEKLRVHVAAQEAVNKEFGTVAALDMGTRRVTPEPPPPVATEGS